MPDKNLIQFCTPTLANIKAGSIFSCKDSLYNIKLFISHYNKQLNSLGIYLICLSYKNNIGLIYVYRPEKLLNDFSNSTTKSLLTNYGYNALSTDNYIKQLSKKLQNNKYFPHEIGLFLGYPPEDVIGFIKNKGNNYIYSGYWKVYHNPESTKKIFNLYREYTALYTDLYNKGKAINQLIVT